MHQPTRRKFLASCALASGSLAVPYFLTGAHAQEKQSENGDRPPVGLVGCGGQGISITNRAREFGQVVALCDVDRKRAEAANQKLSAGSAEIFSDYRRLLDRKDIAVVTIGTPDHWHSKIAIEALQAGKDVYCEKPLTLTIDEGKLICEAVRRTGRVFQVGTQQRSEGPFAKAVALVREGRIGAVQRVSVMIGGGEQGGPFMKADPPSHLDWNFWLGQTPKVDYIPERSHYQFRWWYEYSGGKMTDWGAHHVDIAHWVLGAEDTGPVSIEGTAEHPIPLKDGHPTRDDHFNTALSFTVHCKFSSGQELVIRDKADPSEVTRRGDKPERYDNGVWIVGDKGNIFVNRGMLEGTAVDELATNPLPEDAVTKVCKGQQHGQHMRNFFECVKSREQPISDVFSHHRAITTCHLANIAIRLGRPVTWNPVKEQITGDDDAAAWQSREQRSGFEVKL